MKKLVGFVFLLTSITGMAQVDTSYVYNTTTPYGTLDIRIRKSSTRYYYLQENVTFSFRESSPGVKTNTFYDMTSFDSSPYSQGNMRERNGTSDAFVMNYRLLFPQNYNPNYSEGYPMIVMMHGAGERANCWDSNCFWATRDWRPQTNNPAAPTSSNHPLLNNDLNLAHGGNPHLQARNLAGGKLPDDPTLDPRAFPGFVLFPQNLNGWESTPMNDAVRLVRLVAKKYKIDPDRIYVHGLSNGGIGTYDAIKRAPWLFAAALPMSAPNDNSLNSLGLVPTVAHIPVWTFQGGQDTAPSPAQTESYVKRFREGGMDVRYTKYSNLGHGTWNTAYAEPDFFSWMLSKKKSNVHVFYNNTKICATNGAGVKLGFAAGYSGKYQWEKDGNIISGATSNEYIATEPGVYRGRFSRKANPSSSDWNEWSQYVTITETELQKPEVKVTGTRFMRGPDNNVAYNTIHLTSVTPNDKYYWYRNGVLINVANTSLDDTTRTITFITGSSSGNGKYTLQTMGFDNCPTPASDTVYLYFGNSGPTMATSNNPTGFTGSAASNKSVNLSWNDNSSIETEYEIWRRKPGDYFRLAGRVPANQTTFYDDFLEPSVTYNYKVRAITHQARSAYAPSNSSGTNLNITTLPDNTPPSDPSNLVVTGNTSSSITLGWTASDDDTGIRRYHISYDDTTIVTPTRATTFTITGLPLNVAYNISVRAEDLGGNMSAGSAETVGSTYITGLRYGHSTGAWTDLDQITGWNNPEFTGSVSTFTIAPRTQEDFFFFDFNGYLYINNAGDYQFRVTSDDGSRLTLNGTVIVDNDGVHGDRRVTSSWRTLTSGAHPINVRYFEYNAGQSLSVQYRGPDTNNWTTIPASALKSAASPPVVSSSINERVVLSETRGADQVMTVNVFPNPSSPDNIYVRVQSLLDAPVDVKMIDMMGRPYYKNTFSKEQMEAGAKISPTNHVLNGMYVIVVNQGTATVKQKLIIRN